MGWTSQCSCWANAKQYATQEIIPEYNHLKDGWKCINHLWFGNTVAFVCEKTENGKIFKNIDFVMIKCFERRDRFGMIEYGNKTISILDGPAELYPLSDKLIEWFLTDNALIKWGEVNYALRFIADVLKKKENKKQSKKQASELVEKILEVQDKEDAWKYEIKMRNKINGNLCTFNRFYKPRRNCLLHSHIAYYNEVSQVTAYAKTENLELVEIVKKSRYELLGKVA